MEGEPGAERLALCREVVLYAQIGPEEYTQERVRGLFREARAKRESARVRRRRR